MQRAVDFPFLLSCAWSRGAEDCDIFMQRLGIAIFILAAVICIAVLWYLTRKPTKEKEVLQKQNDLKSEKETLGKENKGLQKNYESLKSENERLVKEKEDLQKQNETLKKEREKVEDENKGLQKNYDHLKREKETLGKEKEALQRKYESLKKEKKKVEAENKGLQKNYDHLKREKERLGKEKEDLQKQNESLKREKERLVKEKEDLQKQNESLKKEKKNIEDENKGLQKNYDDLQGENERLVKDLKDLQRNTNTCVYVLGRAWEKMTKARVNMTLDPDTASPSLTVSEDGSRVRFTGERSAEWPSVLGREGFTSGRHYWEVEVGEKGYWVLGVSTHPHEKSIPEKPGEGYWLVRLVRGKTCTAVSQSGDQILNLEKICKVWGVYLDHEGGRLSFCNAETRFHIHTLEGPFPGQVYPIFSPGSHDKGPLIIQRVQHTAANLI